MGIALVIAACSPSDAGGDTDATTNTAAPVTQAGSTAPPATAAPATAAAPTTAEPEYPVEVSLFWECKEIEGSGRADTFECTNDDRSQRFRQGYWFVGFAYDRDDQGVPVALSGGGNGYNGFCEWMTNGAQFEAPIEDGLATFELSLTGTGLCEGETFTFEGTWDHTANVFTMDGVIEPGG